MMFSYSVLRAVVDLAADRLGDDIQLTVDYSGRGMYGERCVGIDVESVGAYGALVAAASELASEPAAEELLMQFVRDVRTDSMGMGSIFYFPGVQLDPADLAEAKADEEAMYA